MGKRLAGKTILITGASSGIGQSTAFAFARECHENLKLVLAARRVESLNRIAVEIAKEFGDNIKILPTELDVSNATQVHDFVGKLPAEFQNIDVLVNNA